MTPEAQRIAIAEACGAKWRCVSCASHASLSFNESDYEANWEWCQKDSHRMCDDTIPNYPADLNAMHEAEMWLHKNRGVHFLENYYEEALPLAVGGMDGCWQVTSATAAQRAEAFLRTIGKWEDK